MEEGGGVWASRTKHYDTKLKLGDPKENGENARILIENLTKHEHTRGSIKMHNSYVRKYEKS